jgi:superfamily II DNA or RNA helicase
MVSLGYRDGTIELRGVDQAGLSLSPVCRWDRRTACYRAPAMAYAQLVQLLRGAGVAFEDTARQYTELGFGLRVRRQPRPFQSEAMRAWKQAGGRGVIVLPTGAGKSYVGLMAIDDRQRSTLVIAPTLDLVRQWYDLLRASFGVPVGLVGGGEHDVRPLTVTTYDSAYLHMDHLGARFGLVVFDECHHLPGESYVLAAQQCLAPYRLGLSATPEREDGRDMLLDELVGRRVYQRDILDLSGSYLAEFETVRLSVELAAEQRDQYESERAIYLGFLRRHGIRMGSRRGWHEFLMRASRGEEGRRALLAYRRQRELAFAAPAKLDLVAHLLHQHRADRTLIFTEDNATAYRVSRRFLIPSITHQTKVRERSETLERFADGRYGAVVTSRVLNEGVDVPDANVAIVISGSGSVREHVQRLGRILRRQDGKRAVLYELVSANTAEAYTSRRRREHDAYR